MRIYLLSHSRPHPPAYNSVSPLYLKYIHSSVLPFINMGSQSDVIAQRKELVKLTRALKNKLENLKRSESDDRFLLSKTFEPVTSSIEKLIPATRNTLENNIDFAEKSVSKSDVGQDVSEFKERKYPISTVANSENTDYDVSNGIRYSLIDSREVEEERQVGSEAVNRYLDMIYSGDKTLDKIYGIRVLSDGELAVGNSKIVFRKNYLIIKNKKYPTSSGLLELLFLKTPLNYNKEDLKMYKTILLDVGKLKRHPRNIKFRNVVQRLTRSGQMGQGNWMNADQAKVKYYSSLDELVSRLRKLISSQLAGNHGLINEIRAIIQELRDNEVIY